MRILPCGRRRIIPARSVPAITSAVIDTSSPPGRSPLVFIAPIPPAATGNGLAMRMFAFCAAAALDYDVHVVVVPVAGFPPQGLSGPTDAAWTSIIPLPDADRLGSQVAALLAEPAWRARLAAAQPLPRRARLAPATLAGDVVAALSGPAPARVHAGRSFLAPLALAVAERIGAPRVTLDLDDDDEAFFRAAGDQDEADAYARLCRVFLPEFGGIALASPAEAVGMARFGVAATVIPNAVQFPRRVRRRPEGGTGEASLLFVGNLTYAPNVVAAKRLVQRVLPRVRAGVDRPVSVRIVGDTGGDAPLARLGRRPGVELTGFVHDLAPCYAAADVVVAPLGTGGGTRIKLLEAFARRVPVVATSVAASGLDVAHERHLLIADDPAAMAAAVVRVLDDADLARQLTRQAARLVRERYSYEAVVPRIREFLKG